jgi:vacuolar-type H+-ATPase subunit I/STV1
MSSQIVLDLPTVMPTQAIDPVMLAQLNEAWMHNTMQLGYFALVVGFVIGFASAYYYQKRKYGNI